MRPMMFATCGLGLLLSGSALGQGAPGRADIRGQVTKISAAAGGGVVLVEGVKEKTTQYDKASIRITPKTKIEKLVGKERQAANITDLKKGCKVQANFTGPVAESYPVQATARDILILEVLKEK